VCYFINARDERVVKHARLGSIVVIGVMSDFVRQHHKKVEVIN